MHLNDIDREMTNLCRCARSVPICIEMEADLPSLDQLRSNAAECIRLAEAARTSEHKSLSSKWPNGGLRSPSTQLVKVASTVGPCSEIDESSTHYRRHIGPARSEVGHAAGIHTSQLFRQRQQLCAPPPARA